MGSSHSADRSGSATASVRDLLEHRIESGDLQLPVLSTVVMEVVSLCRSEDSSAAELSLLIHRDQTLAGHVLRIANSPLYLPNMQIVSLQQAISRLGMRIIGEIAIALSVKEVAFDVRGYENEVRYLWRHAAAAGGYAREIARQLRVSVESALLCGLLQNVGKPVLLRLIREFCVQLELELEKDDVLFMIEDYHALVGSRMAGAWGLPDVVGETIHYHHDYENAPDHGDQARIAILADGLAQLLLAQDGAYPLGGVEPRPELYLIEGGAATPNDGSGSRSDASHASDDAPDPGDPSAAVDPDPRLIEIERRVRSHPAFADLGLYPEDVDELLANADRIRESLEVFA